MSKDNGGPASDKTQQARRAAFERWADGDHIAHDGICYENPYVESAWSGFNAALDCVVIELPERFVYCSTDSESSYDLAIDECADAIESTNLGIKVK